MANVDIVIIKEMAKEMLSRFKKFDKECESAQYTDTDTAQGILDRFEANLKPIVLAGKNYPGYQQALSISSAISNFNTDSRAEEYFDTDRFWDTLASVIKSNLTELSKLGK